jgi:hypothetical protein
LEIFTLVLASALVEEAGDGSWPALDDDSAPNASALLYTLQPPILTMNSSS